MNWIDLVILGTVAVLALLGLRSGILVPASGVAGVALGLLLAIQYHGELAFALTEHVEGEVVRRVAAFVGIVLGTAVVTRVAASLVRRLLSYLLLGWVDRVAGAAAGALVALVALGTAASLMAGIDIAGLQDSFRASSLASPISQVSLISNSSPWCAQIRHAAAGLTSEILAQDSDPDTSDGAPEECTDLGDVANDIWGEQISRKLSELLGHEVGQAIETVRASLSGAPPEITDLAQQR